MLHRSLLPGLLALCALGSLSSLACSKDDQASLVAKVVDAAAADATPPAGPKSIDLAKTALAAARSKYARHEVVDTDCIPLRHLEADFAESKDPDAMATTREIDVFCGIDVGLEGAVATLKTDNGKLADALKKKDHTTEKMYASTVKDGCSTIRDQLAALTAKHLDAEPKVTSLKAEIDPICSSAKK